MARGKFVRNALLRAVLLCATIFFVVAFCAEAKKSTEWDKDPKHCKLKRICCSERGLEPHVSTTASTIY